MSLNSIPRLWGVVRNINVLFNLRKHMAPKTTNAKARTNTCQGIHADKLSQGKSNGMVIHLITLNRLGHILAASAMGFESSLRMAMNRRHATKARARQGRELIRKNTLHRPSLNHQKISQLPSSRVPPYYRASVIRFLRLKGSAWMEGHTLC